MAKMNTVGATDQLGEKQITVNANKGATTATYTKENGYAILSKIDGNEKKSIQFNSPNEVIDFGVVAELEAYLDAKHEAFQALFNQEI